MASKRGYKIVQTLKQNYRQNVFLLCIYTLFVVVVVTYFTWTTIISDYNTSKTADDPCLASVGYALDVSLLGFTLFCTFGITYDNLRNVRNGFRAFKSEINYIINGDTEVFGDTQNGNGDQLLQEMSSSSTAPTPPAVLERVLEEAAPATRAVLAQQETLQQNITVTTPIGKKIDAKLGVIKSPAPDNAFPSAFSHNAVSGTSMPPNNHPVAARLAEQRDKYTNDVLVWVASKAKKLNLDKSIVDSFMTEIEDESRAMFNVSNIGLDSEEEEGDDSTYESEIYDSAMSLEDIDAKLKRAKMRFEEAIRRKEEENHTHDTQESNNV
jgi:hypothetical protein